MRLRVTKLFFYSAAVLFLVANSYAQSLGDVARQERDRQKADAEKNAQNSSKVITNEDLPAHPAATSDDDEMVSEETTPPSLGSKSPEEWKAEISAKQDEVYRLQAQIENLNSSIRFAPPTCARNCVQYNERQVQKQDQVERMQQQLDQKKKELEDLQEAARKEGFGGSVYEPE